MKENPFTAFFKKAYVKRALRTFFQTAIGYAAMNVTAIDINVKNAVIGLAVSAIAAGVAAVMNLKEENENGK